MIYGKWTECMYSVDPKLYETNKRSDKKNGADSKKQKQVSDDQIQLGLICCSESVPVFVFDMISLSYKLKLTVLFPPHSKLSSQSVSFPFTLTCSGFSRR